MQKQEPSDADYDPATHVPHPMPSAESDTNITPGGTVVQPGISPAGSVNNINSPMEQRYAARNFICPTMFQEVMCNVLIAL